MWDISSITPSTWAFIGLFGIFGGANLSCRGPIALRYALWEYDSGAARAVGRLQLGAALLLAIESSRVFGFALGEFVLFCSIAMLLYKSKFAHALLGLPLLVLLPVTIVP
jgi:hypothetical protein